MKSLTRRISDLVEAAELRHNTKLCDEDRLTLMLSTEHMLTSYIDKFVLGAKDSVLPLTQKPCLQELEHELLDAWAYLQAHKRKLTKI